MSSRHGVKELTNSARNEMAKATQVLDLIDALLDARANPSIRNAQRVVKRIKRLSGNQ
jgi:hypothetical protein